MPSVVLHTQAKKYVRGLPELKPGYTVRVHERIQEGGKERIQVFEGLIIGTHKGHVPTDRSFTVRRVISGIGVEKVFAVHSPLIAKVEVKKVARVRRAKLNFLRRRSGKSVRLNERFTEAGEFAMAVAPVEKKTEETEEVKETKE
ncbi:MAG: large subunit ribosomal protein L19 [Candidatus Peregrinibacteria bacterium Gr01-1014_25]|nr:MAG: large subunit ribosomal protein L19 [Candidatus Peregrinibacteria bacterium Gr01-1014_25]